MKNILIVMILMITPTLLVSQIKWGSPIVDSIIEERTITYTGKKHNSKHAIITYTKTEVFKSVDTKKDIIEKIKKSCITLRLQKNNYSYSESPLTTSYLSKNNINTVQISNYNNKGIENSDTISYSKVFFDTVKSDSKTYLKSIKTLTITLTRINTGNKNITLTANLDDKNEKINISHVIDSLKKIINISVPTQTLSSYILQPISESNIYSLTALTSSNTTNSYTTSVYIYSLQPITNTNVKFNSNKERRALYESYLFFQRNNRGWFYISVGAIGTLSNRTILINEPTYTNDTFINKTKYKEDPIYNLNFTARIGTRFKKYHTFFIEGTYLKQGFNVKYDSINPFIGKREIGANSKEYSVSSYLIGLGYNYTTYSPYRHFFFTSDLGVYASIQNNTNAINITPNKNRFGVKIAMGVAYKPNYRHDFKLMPTLFYDLTPYTSQTIKTRFYSLGVTLSYGISLFKFN